MCTVQFEIRQLNLEGARQILGNAIGMASKDKIFKKSIEIELQLGSVERCRALYENYLHWAPENCYAWRKYAEFEKSLHETERARGIFELAVDQPALDMPELLWKAYIDFEISEGEFDKTRELYERLLDRIKHLKVWLSYAKFEATDMKETSDPDLANDDANLLSQKKQCIQRARRVFGRAVNYFRMSAPELKEERALLLEEWVNVEASFGKLGDPSILQSELPKKVKKKRRCDPAGQEYIDYLFHEETQSANLKILEAAYKWKKQKSSTQED